jgi:hypothetical protein
MTRFGHIRIDGTIYRCLSSTRMASSIISGRLQLLCKYDYREKYNHRVMVF